MSLLNKMTNCNWLKSKLESVDIEHSFTTLSFKVPTFFADVASKNKYFAILINN